MDISKAKRLAYDLTLEAVREDHVMKNTTGDNISEKVKYISKIYSDVLTEITKTNMNL